MVNKPIARTPKRCPVVIIDPRTMNTVMRFQLLLMSLEPLVFYHILILLTRSSLIEHKLYFRTISQSGYSAWSPYETRCPPLMDTPIKIEITLEYFTYL